MSAALAAGITATAATLGTAANVAATSNLNGRNRRWQEQMWNKSNEYNTPLAQKQRLEEAGINPYSVLAGEGADTGQSQQSPAPQTYQYPDMSQAMSNIVQDMSLAKDIELKDIEKQKGVTDLEFYRAEKVAALNDLYEQIGLRISERKRNNMDTEYLEKQRDLVAGMMDSMISKSHYEGLQSETVYKNLQRQYDDAHNESVLQQRSYEAGIRLSKAHAAELNAEIKKIASEINEINARTDLTKQQKENLIDELKTNARNRNSSRLHDVLDLAKNKADYWKQINEMIDEATRIEVPFGSIKLPHPIVGNGSIFQHDDLYKGIEVPWR